MKQTVIAPHKPAHVGGAVQDSVSPYKKLFDAIGNTPLVQLELGTQPTLLAKLEFLSLGGSSKDRAALHMIQDAERKGLLKPGGTIVEASSGNQGIALAMIGKIKGYKVIIVVPSRTSKEKVAILRAYGAEVVIYAITNPDEHHSHKAAEIAAAIPGSFMPNQYFNSANADAHYASTGPEIWQQTQGRITHCVLAMGTCGTISGVGRYLKEQNPAVKIIGVDIDDSAYSSPQPKPYISEGIGVDHLDGLINGAVVDEVLTVSDEQVFAMTRKMADDHGLLVGLSSGAVMHAVLEYCKGLSENDVVVVMLPDSGKAYLSKIFPQD